MKFKLIVATGYLASLVVAVLTCIGIALYREGILWPMLGLILGLAAAAWALEVLIKYSVKTK